VLKVLNLIILHIIVNKVVDLVLFAKDGCVVYFARRHICGRGRCWWI